VTPRKPSPWYDPLTIIWFLVFAGSVVLAVYALAGCCGAPTKCPPPVQHLTTVIQACELPPGPGKLPAIHRAPLDAGCPDALVCYEIPAAAAIADRNSRLIQWIRETKARCRTTVLDEGAATSVDSGRDASTSR